MADEIIKLFEYFASNAIVQGAAIAYIVMGAILLIVFSAIFITAVCTIARAFKRTKK